MFRIATCLAAILAASCGSTPTAQPQPQPQPQPAAGISGCASAPDAATADQNLAAMVGHGEALPAHVGPDAAAAMFADLDANPGVYLARYECAFVSRSPSHGYDSLLLAVPLWRLRRHDPARVAQLATRVVFRYEELARTPPDPAQDPYFPQRLRERTATMTFIRDGLDVATGPRWIAVPAAGYQACTSAAPDSRAAIRVTRECSCGETLACSASAGAGGALALTVMYDPDSPARCTDCYPTSTACSAPAGLPAASLPPRCAL